MKSGLTAKATIVACQVFDVLTTAYGISILGAEEQNPMLVTWLGSPVSFVLLFLLKVALCSYICLSRVVTARDKLILGGTAAVCATAVLRNLSEILRGLS
jgi:hypothetical protein